MGPVRDVFLQLLDYATEKQSNYFVDTYEEKAKVVYQMKKWYFQYLYYNIEVRPKMKLSVKENNK